MERALKNTVLAKDYGISLKSFFKDKFKYWNDSYVIPFSEFRHCKKYLFEFIKSNCNGDTVCGKQENKNFLITNFELTCNVKITLIPTKIKSWRVIAIEKQELNDLSYSERLSYLK